MSRNVFIDTNIFVYAQVLNDAFKHSVARDLLKKDMLDENVFISTQVLGELYSAMSKYKRTHTEISSLLNEIIQASNIAMVTLATVRHCLTIIEKYGYSYWDSLLLATAIETDYEIIYSEDMQHGQVIEEKLTVFNPFIGKR